MIKKKISSCLYLNDAHIKRKMENKDKIVYFCQVLAVDDESFGDAKLAPPVCRPS